MTRVERELAEQSQWNDTRRSSWAARQNAERLAAYQAKLQVWRAEHPEEYWTRLRQGLDVRAKWRRLWERRERQARCQALLRRVGTA